MARCQVQDTQLGQLLPWCPRPGLLSVGKTLPNYAVGLGEMAPSQGTAGRCVRQHPALCPGLIGLRTIPQPSVIQEKLMTEREGGRRAGGRQAGSPRQASSSFWGPPLTGAHCTISCPKPRVLQPPSGFQQNTPARHSTPVESFSSASP